MNRGKVRTVIILQGGGARRVRMRRPGGVISSPGEGLHTGGHSPASDAKTIQRWIASLSSEFLKSLGCRQVPSHTTIWRVLTEVDHGALQKELCGWLAEQFKKLHVALALKQLCLDGKTLRSPRRCMGRSFTWSR